MIYKNEGLTKPAELCPFLRLFPGSKMNFPVDGLVVTFASLTFLKTIWVSLSNLIPIAAR
jgi:hypothetical protein